MRSDLLSASAGRFEEKIEILHMPSEVSEGEVKRIEVL